MPLEEGWIGKAIGKAVVGKTEELSHGLAKMAGITPPVDVAAVGTEADITSEWGIAGLSWFAALIGSPLGILPFLTDIYRAGLAQTQSYDAARAYRPARLPPAELNTLIHRQIITEEDLDAWLNDLRDWGWSESRIMALREASRPILGIGEIRDLYLRGELGEGEVADTEAIRRLTAHGFTVDDAQDLKTLFYFIPSPTDLIRMAVREAWRDDVAETFETDSEFEMLPLDVFRKAGVSPEWLKSYWRAHWELPSVGQAFEMLHRKVITSEELEMLLRTQDVMPFWRDKLTAIAYQPVTRVDVRRMYRLGVFEEADLPGRYEALGYNKEDAQAMTEFTVRYENRDDVDPTVEYRDLTRALILDAYEDKAVSRDEALLHLESITFKPDDAELIVALEDSKEASRIFKDELSFIGKAYGLGVMTDEDMIDSLGKLDLSATRQDYYIEKFRTDRIRKAARPTVADLKRWFKAELINTDTFYNEMRIEGYPDYYIAIYEKELAE